MSGIPDRAVHDEIRKLQRLEQPLREHPDSAQARKALQDEVNTLRSKPQEYKDAINRGLAETDGAGNGTPDGKRHAAILRERPNGQLLIDSPYDIRRNENNVHKAGDRSSVPAINPPLDANRDASDLRSLDTKYSAKNWDNGVHMVYGTPTGKERDELQKRLDAVNAKGPAYAKTVADAIKSGPPHLLTTVNYNPETGKLEIKSDAELKQIRDDADRTINRGLARALERWFENR